MKALIFGLGTDYNFRTLLTGSGLKAKLIRDGFGSLLLRSLFIIFTFLMGVVLVRTMGAENYGVFSYVTSIVTILTIPAEFGLPTLVLRETAKNMATENWSKIKGVWTWAMRIIGLITLLILLGALFAYWIWGKQFDDSYTTTFTWGLLIVPLFSLGHLRGAQLRGLKKVVLGLLPELVLVPALLIVFVLVFALVLGREVSASQAMALKALAAALSFIIGAVLLAKNTPANVKTAIPVVESKNWLASALPFAGINGISVLNKQVGLLILGLFVGATEIAYYKAAVNFSILASFGLEVVNLTVAPQFASMYARGEFKKLQKLVTFSARIALLLNFVITLVLVLFGKSILTLAYKQAFVASYIPLTILLVGQFVNSATGSVGYLLNMTGKEIYAVRGIAIATVVNILLNLVLSPRYGMIGAAIGTTISMMISNIYNWLAVRKQLGLNSFAVNFNGFEK